MKFLFYTGICFLLLIVLVTLVILLSLSLSLSLEEKGSPFECGFISLSGTGFSFSMPFFIFSLVFLLFDVEILLVCFFPFLSDLSVYGALLTLTIIVLIMWATLYEWVKGVLSWV